MLSIMRKIAIFLSLMLAISSSAVIKVGIVIQNSAKNLFNQDELSCLDETLREFAKKITEHKNYIELQIINVDDVIYKVYLGDMKHPIRLLNACEVIFSTVPVTIVDDYLERVTKNTNTKEEFDNQIIYDIDSDNVESILHPLHGKKPTRTYKQYYWEPNDDSAFLMRPCLIPTDHL